MQVQTLEHEWYEWKYNTCGEGTSSQLHYRAYGIVKEEYPNIRILEEVPIKIKMFGGTLFMDIYLPTLNLCIEVMGQQHYTYSKFFHRSMNNFRISQMNDENKKQWCTLNDIGYLELRYDESKERWKQKLRTKTGRDKGAN